MSFLKSIHKAAPLLLLGLTLSVQGQGSLEQAHHSFRTATNAQTFAEAAHHYEKLHHEEGLQNGELFYNIGNSWFMAGDVGRAILNYRRAELFLPGNENLQHNLKAALQLRSDLIATQPPHPLVGRFLSWHINTAPALRWMVFAVLWVLFWSACYWLKRSNKKEARLTVIGSGLLALILMTSLSADLVSRITNKMGVVTASEILARKGNSEMYAPAFLEPLHSGTEFRQLEVRDPWMHIELADGQTCWIPTHAGELVLETQ